MPATSDSVGDVLDPYASLPFPLGGSWDDVVDRQIEPVLVSGPEISVAVDTAISALLEHWDAIAAATRAVSVGDGAEEVSGRGAGGGGQPFANKCLVRAFFIGDSYIFSGSICSWSHMFATFN